MKQIEFFNKQKMDNASQEELKSILNDLSLYINKRLLHVKSRKEYGTEATKIIEDLKRVGHELYSWDYDGQREA